MTDAASSDDVQAIRHAVKRLPVACGFVGAVAPQAKVDGEIEGLEKRSIDATVNRRAEAVAGRSVPDCSRGTFYGTR